MGITASNKGTGQDFEPVAAGRHDAICYMVCDLGTQYNQKFDSWKRQVQIGWEIPGERIKIQDEDGNEQDKPRVVSKRYTLSLHPKSILRQDLESWRGKTFTAQEELGFDISKLIGCTAELQIIHNTKDDRTYANVKTVLAPREGVKKVRSENEPVYFSFEDGGDFPEDRLYQWLVDTIKASQEWQDRGRTEEPPPVDDDDIPF